MWKYLQKNEIKNIISEIINKIIPNFILFKTLMEWNPWYVLSRVVSRHHWNMIVKINKIVKKYIQLFLVLNIKIILINKFNNKNDLIIGQGL